MTKRYSAETDENFLKLLKKWVKIEQATIRMTEGLLKKVDSQVVKVLIDTIHRDSQKHQMILELILEGLEGTVTLTPDDMGILGEFLQKHTAIEQESVDIAEQSLKKVRTPIAKFLLEYLHKDEQKHDFIMESLDKLKGTAMIPT